MKRALLAALVLATPVAADTLRFGTEGAYPPYNFLTAEGAPQGLDIDLGNEICARLNRECDWTLRPWDDLIPGLEAGDYDAIIAAMADTSARRERVAFTRPYEPPPAPSIYVGWLPFPDLETSVIAVQGGTIHEAHLRGLGRSVRPYPTAQAAFDAMMNEEVDLVFGAPSFLEHRVYRTSRALQIVGRETLSVGASAIAVGKNDPLLGEIDAALDDMIEDGTLERLRALWLPKSEDT